MLYNINIKGLLYKGGIMMINYVQLAKFDAKLDSVWNDTNLDNETFIKEFENVCISAMEYMFSNSVLDKFPFGGKIFHSLYKEAETRAFCKTFVCVHKEYDKLEDAFVNAYARSNIFERNKHRSYRKLKKEIGKWISKFDFHSL